MTIDKARTVRTGRVKLAGSGQDIRPRYEQIEVKSAHEGQGQRAEKDRGGKAEGKKGRGIIFTKICFLCP